MSVVSVVGVMSAFLMVVMGGRGADGFADPGRTTQVAQQPQSVVRLNRVERLESTMNNAAFVQVTERCRDTAGHGLDRREV